MPPTSASDNITPGDRQVAGPDEHAFRLLRQQQSDFSNEQLATVDATPVAVVDLGLGNSRHRRRGATPAEVT